MGNPALVREVANVLAREIQATKSHCRAHPRYLGVQGLVRVQLLSPRSQQSGAPEMPNPSLERTSTGLALGPQGYSGSSSASRPKHQPGGVRSAQTLGSAARQSIEPAKYIEPGARRRQKPECRAWRGELSGGFRRVARGGMIAVYANSTVLASAF